MIAVRPDAGEMLSRLEAASRQPGMPSRVAERCRLLIERLQRPVRLGLLGLPGAGKPQMLNAIAGGRVIPDGLTLPTVEARHGPAHRATVTRGDGSVLHHEGPLDEGVLLHDPIFLQVEAPFDGLRGRSVLNLVAEAVPEEIGPALSWAAKRCDIALWCARDWSAFERETWGRAPESLRNHAILIHSAEEGGPVETGPEERAAGFEKVFRITPLRLVRDRDMKSVRPVAGLDGLLAHLQQVIDAGHAADHDAALMLLHRHGRRETRPEAPAALSPVRPAPPAAPDPQRAADALSPEAHAALSRGFLLVRRCASDLLETLPEGPLSDETAEHVLTEVDAALEALLGVFDSDDELGEALPELNDAVVEARELALLLRIEGGAAQAEEAAALLLQIRRETESVLVI